MQAIATDAGYDGGITGQNVYLQNFDVLASLPTSWTNNSSVQGVYLKQSGSLTLTQGTGSSPTGGFYSYGSSNASDRALGYLPSGNTGPGTIALRFRNTGPIPITGIWLDYVGEQWRTANTLPSSLAFSYITSNTTISDVFSGAGTAVTSLNFTSPVNKATSVPLNGNLAENQKSFTKFYLAFSSPIPTNGEFAIRWVHARQASGSGHGLAVDSLRVKAVPEPASLMALAVGLGALRRRRRRCR